MTFPHLDKLLEEIKKRHPSVQLINFYTNLLNSSPFKNFVPDEKLNLAINLFYICQLEIERVVYTGVQHPMDVNGGFTLLNLIWLVYEDCTVFMDALFELTKPMESVPKKSYVLAKIEYFCRVWIPRKINKQEIDQDLEKQFISKILSCKFSNEPDYLEAQEFVGNQNNNEELGNAIIVEIQNWI